MLCGRMAVARWTRPSRDLRQVNSEVFDPTVTCPCRGHAANGPTAQAIPGLILTSSVPRNFSPRFSPTLDFSTLDPRPSTPRPFFLPFVLEPRAVFCSHHLPPVDGRTSAPASTPSDSCSHRQLSLEVASYSSFLIVPPCVTGETGVERRRFFGSG